MKNMLKDLFPTDKELEQKLKGYATTPNYKEIFFGHLGSEFIKIFEEKKDNTILKNFLEASQYEYGFFNKKIDLEKAFSLYKKYADQNDYFCMYKMHTIYLCEYAKFNVPFDRVLEKLYILKCFAYLPNFVFDWYLKLYEKIDVMYELAQILDIEDRTLSKHKNFIDLLYDQKEKYNLAENDIYLMKGVLTCYFQRDVEDTFLVSFCELNSVIPKCDNDYAYYEAKNKCIYFKRYLKNENKNIISDDEIEKFYNDIENKKLYQYYSDYGNYLLEKSSKIISKKIIDIFKISADNGYLFSKFRYYQCLLNYYTFPEILNDFNIAANLLNYLIEEIVFENILKGQFILLIGILMEESKYQEKLSLNYFKYIKDINDYISSMLKSYSLDKNNEDYEYLWGIKGYIYYFGFKGIEEKNIEKSIEMFNESSKISKKGHLQKRNAYFVYKAKEINNCPDEELACFKKKVVDIFLGKLNIKNEIFDCYILGNLYWDGIYKKKDESLTLLIFKSAENMFCKTIIDNKIKYQIKEFLKTHNHKINLNYKEEICCICYDKKINKILIPCKHYFCSFCINKLGENSNCPMCRSDILCIY